MNMSKKISYATSSFEPLAPELSFPVDIQFRHMPVSKAIIDSVEHHAAKLEKYHLVGASCTVVIDETHHRTRTGIFEIHARLKVPGESLYVACSSDHDMKREDLYGAVTEVFDCLNRQLSRAHEKSKGRLRREARRAA